MKKLFELLKVYVLDKLRSPLSVALSIFWVLAFFLFLFYVFEKGGLSFGGMEFGKMFIASYIVFIPAYISVFGTLGGLIGDIEKGVLRAYRGSRLKKSEYFTAKILVSTLSSMVMVAVLLFMAFYMMQVSMNLLVVLITVVMTIVSHAGIAFIAASLAKDSHESRMVAQTSMILLIAGTPLFYPETMLPESIRLLQQMIPLTHSIGIMRAMVNGVLTTGLFLEKTAILAAFSAVLLGLGYRRFEF